MSVRISSIADAGNPEKERIVMKVSSDGDIGRYAMLRARYREGSVTTGVTDVFWLPDQNIGSGDLVFLTAQQVEGGLGEEVLLESGVLS